MLMSPESYGEMLKNFTLDELMGERNRLIKSIRQYDEIKERGYDFAPQCPDAHTIYRYDHLYLAEVCKLIYEKGMGCYE